jgi:hypothetical protein
LIAGKSTTYGVSVNGTAVSNPGNAGNGAFAEGLADIKLVDRSGNLFDPTFSFLNPREADTFKMVQLFLGGNLITTLEASSKGNDRLAAVPTPEPGTFFLLAGVMAVGFGVLRKRIQK